MLDEETDEETETASTLKFGEGQDFKSVLSTAQKFQKEFSTSEEIPDDKVPQSYDFRALGGYDFTNGHRDQKACGSCYTFGFIQAVQSRLKLKYGKDVPNLSVQ